MTEPKKDEKKSKQRKSRAKFISATDFLEATKTTLINKCTDQEQNVIVKELYFAVREKRKLLIDEINESIEKGGILVKLNEELNLGK